MKKTMFSPAAGRKAYCAPVMQVIAIKPNRLVCTSSLDYDDSEEYDPYFAT